MPNEEIVKYVLDQRARGNSDESSIKELLKSGWSSADIHEVVGGGELKYPTPNKIEPGFLQAFAVSLVVLGFAASCVFVYLGLQLDYGPGAGEGTNLALGLLLGLLPSIFIPAVFILSFISAGMFKILLNRHDAKYATKYTLGLMIILVLLLYVAFGHMFFL